MSKNSSAASGGIGLGTLIFIVFLILKLGEFGQVKDWSWWWVTSPLWIPIGLVLSILLIAVIIALVVRSLGD